MNFTPTSDMRYAASLRSILHKRILKEGLSGKNKMLLRKIYLFEGVSFSGAYTETLDMRRLADMLFGALVLLQLSSGKTLFTKITGRGEYSVNRRLFEIAVCTLSAVAADGAELSFFALSGGVLLTVSRIEKPPQIIYPYSIPLRRLPDGLFGIFLPMPHGMANTPIRSETEYLLDRYSVPNIFSCL